MRTRLALAGALALLGAPASAQVDTNGLPTAPWSGGPVRVTSPWPVGRLGWAASASVRWSRAPLVAWTDEGSGSVPRALVGDGLDVGLGGMVGVHRRISVGATLPVRVAAAGELGGPAVGDLTLWAPLALVVSERAALALVPRLTVPTGAPARAFGAGGWRAGAELSGGARLGRLRAVGSAGLERVPAGAVAGGWLLGGGAAVEVAAGPWSLGGELRGRAPLSDPDGTRGVGTELLAVARWSGGRGVVAAAFGGAPIGVEPGVTPLSGLALVGARSVPSGQVDPVAAPSLQVVDADGRPVRGAELLDGGQRVGSTDAAGEAVRPARGGLIVRAPGLLDTPAPAGVDRVVMPYAPVSVEVRVTDGAGRPVDATLVTRPTEVAAIPWSHGYRLELEPGSWTLRVEAEGFGAQERTIDIAPRRVDGIPVEVVLLPAAKDGARLDLAVVDPESRRVSGARVVVGGLPVGTTGTGGDVVVEGLAGDTHRVEVASPQFRDRGPAEVRAGPRQEVALGWRPGSVRIVARGPDGAVTDGLAQITGPTALPPVPLGEDGERLVVLEEGDWRVLVSSAALGVQERLVEVRPDSPLPLVAEFVLRPESEGADLIVRVVEPDGTGLLGAEVRVDGEPFGRTASAGLMRLDGIPRGAHRLEVLHPAALPVELEVEVGADLAEVVVPVRWRADVVLVAATDATYDPVDALVQFNPNGPAGPSVAPGSLGARGRRVFEGVPTGGWEVVVSSLEHGVETRTVDVGGEDLATAVVVFRDEGGSGRLDVRVVDPEGSPAGAPVWIDGSPVGRADGGRLSIEGLRAGPRTIAACDGALARTEVPVVVRSQRGTVEIACPWAQGATRVRVLAGGEPVTDALVRVGGPFPVRPAPLDGTGRRVFALAPGPWSVLVSSVEHGVVERPVEVASDGLTEVEIAFGAVGGVLLRVEEPGGRPVVGARVRVEGALAGETGPGGLLRLEGLPSRPVRLAVEGPHHAPFTTRVEVGATARDQLVEVQPLRVPVQVRVAGPGGEGVRARVTAVGPRRVEPVAVDGAGRIELVPGAWTLIAEAEGLAPASAEVALTADGAGAPVVFELRPTSLVREGSALRSAVRFDPDVSELDPSFQAMLREVAAICLADPSIVRLEAQGHTDATGDPAYNLQLSQRRAERVREALVALGVPPSRVEARGYGSTRPIADDATESGRAANRRVEFAVIEQALSRP